MKTNKFTGERLAIGTKIFKSMSNYIYWEGKKALLQIKLFLNFIISTTVNTESKV